MAAKITRDILESYLHCKLKGYLKLTGQQGTKSDYETLLTEMRAGVRLAAIDKILTLHPGEVITRNIPLTTSALKQGGSYLLDATLEDDLVSLAFAGLKKVDGPSKLGDFHYIPMLFHEGETVRKEQKFLLEIYGLLLSRLQGQMPAHGIVWHGKERKATRVRLNADLRQTERLFRDLKEMCCADSPPKLMLNDHCQVCEFRQRCHEQAVKDDNISLLRGMSEKEVRSYEKKGIFTVTQLAYTFRPRRKRNSKHIKMNRRYHSLQALAIRDKKTYVFGAPTLPTSSVRIYLDIEGLPESDFYYLIGLLVFDGSTVKHKYFWADSKAQEETAWKSFLDTVSTISTFSLFHYGSYETRFLTSMASQYGISPELRERLGLNSVNVLSILYTHVYFPIHSNSLKSVATFLGFKWSTDGASGLQSIAWRCLWEKTRDEALKQKLISYNYDDCQALHVVTAALDSIAGNAPTDSAFGSVSHAEDLKREHPYGFGRNEFFFPEWDQINKCAYFDYQRQRVFLRTSESVRKSLQREKRRRRNVRINKTIWCEPPTHCEVCHARTITKQGALSKIVYDMKLFNGGIKKWIVRYRSNRYMCKTCGKAFVPSNFQLLASKFGNTLLAWSVYRNIELRQSHGTIMNELAEVFGFVLSDDLAARLKSKASKLYQRTYDSLAEKIRKGDLAHADETKVSIKGVHCYVWAFTNLQEVIYVYSDTREGDILGNVLSGFKGILISDFYAAYDSVECIQQKCLIHLIRDMNDDLYKNPFDEELNKIARDFSATLTPIIETIDKYGLAKYHLNKHICHAKRLVEQTSLSVFESPLAKNYQRRIAKYKDKLFVFLEHDEVPWNNNNAEHAIKRFAFLRKVIGGTSTVKGIKEYLVLLSVCETLRLRGVSVLKFLVSGCSDIEQFTKDYNPRK